MHLKNHKMLFFSHERKSIEINEKCMLLFKRPK